MISVKPTLSYFHQDQQQPPSRPTQAQARYHHTTQLSPDDPIHLPKSHSNRPQTYSVRNLQKRPRGRWLLLSTRGNGRWAIGGYARMDLVTGALYQLSHEEGGRAAYLVYTV
jgi:hypothetical protein